MKKEKVPSMFDYKNNGVSVSLIFRPKAKEEETSPIYWRVIYQRKQRHYFSGFSFSLEEWKEFATTNRMKHRDTRKTLTDYFENVLKGNISDLINKGIFSFDTLNQSLSKGDATSVLSVLEAKAKQLANEKRVRYSQIHEGTMRALQRYKHYSKQNKKEKEEFVELIRANKFVSVGETRIKVDKHDISFDEITADFLHKFDAFLRETGAGNSTIAIYMRTLRSTINRNDEAGEPYIPAAKYPFGAKKGKYNIPESERKSLAKPIEDIWKIEDFETDNLKLAFARDVFVFLFYANGLNFGDFCRLRYDNINHDTGELEIKRKKTNRAGSRGQTPTIYIPLTPPLVRIINRHGNKDTNGYIFPILNNVRGERAIVAKINETIDLSVNKPLKVIAEELGVGDISTSTARNSYMTHLQTELMYSNIVTKQLVGHKVTDVTGGYVNLNPKKRLEINTKLLNPNQNYKNVVKIRATL